MGFRLIRALKMTSSKYSIFMTIIFDFDGTLANTLSTLIDIYNNYIVKEFRCKPFDRSMLEEFQKKTPVRVYEGIWRNND